MKNAMNTVPRPFQIAGAEFIERNNGRALMAWEMGSGKSLLSLLYAYRNPEVFPIIIVCPAALKWNWERECTVHFSWRAEVLQGTKPKRTPIPSHSRIIILNYDILKPWIPYLLELKPGLIIYDEGHAVSGRTTKRAKASLLLADKIPRVIVLTGTPMMNRPSDLWAPLRLASSTLFPSFMPYAHRYCAPKRKFYGWDFSGASHLKELHEKIQPVTSRLRKIDVLKDLPEQQDTIVLLDLTDREEYEKVRDEYLSFVGDGKPSLLGKEARDKARGSLFRLKHLVAQLKLPAVFDWFDQFFKNSEEKIICFGIHRESVVEAIYEKYKKRSAIITGKTSGKEKQIQFDKFLRDPKCQLLSGNIDAAGVGLSARGVSNTAFVELPWTPAKVDQGKARTHGIGRGEAGKICQSWFLIARGTVEEKLLGILQRKRGYSDQVLDGGKTDDPFDLYDELTEMLKKEKEE